MTFPSECHYYIEILEFENLCPPNRNKIFQPVFKNFHCHTTLVTTTTCKSSFISSSRPPHTSNPPIPSPPLPASLKSYTFTSSELSPLYHFNSTLIKKRFETSRNIIIQKHHYIPFLFLKEVEIIECSTYSSNVFLRNIQVLPILGS